MTVAGSLPRTPTRAPAESRCREFLFTRLRLTGVLAKQDVVFGGVGETLTITHDTHSRDAYQAGIIMALRFMDSHTGLAVGLEHALRPAAS